MRLNLFSAVDSHITWGNVVRVWRAPGIRCVGRCHWGVLGNSFHTEAVHSDTLDGLSTLHSDKEIALAGMWFSGEAAVILRFTAQIWFPACTILKNTVLLFGTVFPSHLNCLSNQKWAFFQSLDTRSCSVPDRAPMLPKGSRNLASLSPLSFKALILQSVSSPISWKLTAFVELLLFGIVFSFICNRNNNFSVGHFLKIHDMLLFSTLLLGYRF